MFDGNELGSVSSMMSDGDNPDGRTCILCWGVADSPDEVRFMMSKDVYTLLGCG